MAKKDEQGTPDSELKDPKAIGSFDQKMFAVVDDTGNLAANLLSQLPVGQGYYFKVSKKSDIGAPPEFLTDIDLNEPIEDLETYLQRLAVEKGWGSGDYLIRTLMHGERGLRARPFLIRIRIPKDETVIPQKAIPVDNKKDLKQYLTEFSEISEGMRKVVEPIVQAAGTGQQQPVDMAALIKAIADAVKREPPAIQESLKTQFTDLMSIVNANKPKEHDMFDLLKKMKDSGLIPQPEKPQDSISQLQQMMQIMKLVRELAPEPASEGRVSVAAEVIKALSPHIGDLLGTLKEGISVFREARGVKPRKPAVSIPEKTPELPKEPTVPDHPLLQELYKAIEKNDQTYYPKLVHGIGYYVENGDQYLQAAIQGVLSPDQVQGFLVDMGGEYFRQGKVKDYMASFVDWYRKKVGAILENSTEDKLDIESVETIKAVCVKCHEAYEFEDEESWKQDSKLCDNETESGACKGEIVLEAELTKGTA